MLVARPTNLLNRLSSSERARSRWPSPAAAKEVVDRIGATHFDVIPGDEGFVAACQEADVIINGVVGFAGLPVTLETLRLGRRLGLANKESLIAAGPVVQKVRTTPGAEIVPVDSEHCALHQCLRANESFQDGRFVSGSGA